MQSTVRCELRPETNTIAIYDAGGDCCGFVEDFDGEPIIKLFSDQRGIAYLSFSNIDIIVDNWNALQELRRTSGKA
jgi:hypothetical protein